MAVALLAVLAGCGIHVRRVIASRHCSSEVNLTRCTRCTLYCNAQCHLMPTFQPPSTLLPRQVRVGQLAAGNFGVPQGRWRVFMFAAAPGQQLPAIPKPTHNCVKFQHAMSKNAQRIVSGFTSEEDCFAAYSQVLLGDILSDLPCVDNFELQDRQRYAGPPERLTQAWLRRKPAPWMTPLVDRMAYQDEYQRAAHDELVERLIKEAEVHGLRGLGKEALANTKNPLRYQKEKNGEAKKRKDDHSAGNHAFESIDACFRHIQDPKIQAVMWLQVGRAALISRDCTAGNALAWLFSILGMAQPGPQDPGGDVAAGGEMVWACHSSPFFRPTSGDRCTQGRAPHLNDHP
jgi:hypothetical protein